MIRWYIGLGGFGTANGRASARGLNAKPLNILLGFDELTLFDMTRTAYSTY